VAISLATGVLTSLEKGEDKYSGNRIVRGMHDNVAFPRPGVGSPLIDSSGHVVGIVGPMGSGIDLGDR
jgi:hypothetical protein